MGVIYMNNETMRVYRDKKSRAPCMVFWRDNQSICAGRRGADSLGTGLKESRQLLRG